MIEKVNVPIDWVYEDVEAVLRVVIILGGIKSILKSLNAIDSEHLREAFNLLGVWVLGNTYKVLVEVFHCVQVWLNGILILTSSSTD